MKTINFFFTILFFIGVSTNIEAQTSSWTQIGDNIYGAEGDYSAFSKVSLNSDGSILAVGAPLDSDYTGFVKVYQNVDNEWTQIGQTLYGDDNNNFFGWVTRLSADGNTIAIGARGAAESVDGYVRIFQFNDDMWVQIGEDIEQEVVGSEFGFSLDLNSNGEIVVIGAPYSDPDDDENKGYVSIFEYTGGSWVQMGATIEGSSIGSRLGYSVSINFDGTIIATGAVGNDEGGIDRGQLRVFEFTTAPPGGWVQIGSNINGDCDYCNLGESVSISSDGSIVAVSSANYGVEFFGQGQVKIFQNNDGDWIQIGDDIFGDDDMDYFGIAIDLNSMGSIIAIGAEGYNIDGTHTGRVDIFQNNSGDWLQIGDGIYGETALESFGKPVSLNSTGDIIAIGAAFNDQGPFNNGGTARVFGNNTVGIDDFNQIKFNFYPNPTSGVLFIEADNIQRIEVMDVLGRIVYKVKHSNRIDLSGKEKGTYIIKAFTEKGVSIMKVILK